MHTFFYNNRKLTATSGGSVVVDTGFAVKTGTSILGLLDPLAMSSGAKTLIACTKFSAFKAVQPFISRKAFSTHH